MAEPTPQQLAAILTKAANHRIDVKRALFTPDPERPEEIIAEVNFENSDARKIDTRASKLLDGRTVGAILEEWFGPEPGDVARGARSPRWHAEHNHLLNNTPNGLLDHHQAGLLELPEPPPPGTFPYSAEPGHPTKGPEKS